MRCLTSSSKRTYHSPRRDGFFPANAVCDDVELYTDNTRTDVLEKLHFLRQQSNREGNEPCRSLADFIAPKENGIPDYVGAFAVTSGIGLKELCETFRAENDDYNAIMAEALADRLAEAFAECLHKKARDQWGFGREENLSIEEVLHEKYRGIRPAPGIRPVRIILRKVLSGVCSMSRQTPEFRSQSHSQCGRGRASAESTSPILSLAISASERSIATR